MDIPIQDITALLISLTALIISIVALIFTIAAFMRKRGLNIRGSFSACSSIYCDDKYISNLTLENLKDRSAVIFKVYLKIGHNIYLQIDDFEGKPLILKAFEVYKKRYDPIDFYAVNMKKIDLNSLLDDKKVKKKIILSTTEGRYSVNTRVKHWNPLYLYFKNHLIGTILPIRTYFKGKAYGGNTRYIICLKLKNGKEEVIGIHPKDYEVVKFKDFSLTKQSLLNKKTLRNFLLEKLKDAQVPFKEIEVHDLQENKDDLYESKAIIKAKNHNWFVIYVLGRVLTIVDNYKLKRKNAAVLKKSKK